MRFGDLGLFQPDISDRADCVFDGQYYFFRVLLKWLKISAVLDQGIERMFSPRHSRRDAWPRH